MPNLLKTFCLYLGLPILISIAGLFFYQQPQYSGTFISPSNGYNAITIKRDEFGVPTIESKTLRDTLYGLGYVHAQDRLWTMHFKKLLIHGRLSEMFGSEGLVIDKFFRNLSLKRYSENATEYIDDHSKDLFQSYVNGINDYVASLKVLPLQFWIIWTNVENFTVTDSISGAKFLSFFLAMDFPFEFIYETLEALVGKEKADEIIPHRKDQFLWNEKVIINDNELKQMKIYDKFNASTVFNLTEKLLPIPPERLPFEPTHCPECVVDGEEGPNVSNEPHHGAHDTKGSHKEGISERMGDQVKAMKEQYVLGSNAWVIHGNHTTTGKPILASDPHLTNGMPSFWYNVVLKYEGNHVAGLSLPGGPGIIIGKTKYVAWGLTNLFADTSDIYTLTTKGEHYLYEGAWRPLRKIKETIKVRGQSELEEVTLYESHHGVVLDHHLAFPFLGMTFAPSGLSKTYVLSWIGFAYTKTSMIPIVNLLNATSAQEIVDTWKDSTEPSLSFVFATAAGDIGYLSLGKIPVRRRVDDGRKPKDGSKKENDWLGFVPWEDQPRVINPQKGYIVSANNKISTDNIKWRVSTSLMSTSRAARVDEMLREYVDNGKKISVEITKKMQADTLDILARQLIPTIEDDLRRALKNEAYMNTVRIHREILDSMLDQLHNWDFRMDTDSVPAGIFGTWHKFFLRRVLKKLDLNEEDHGAIIGNFRIDHFVFRNLMNMYDDTNTKKHDDFWCQDDAHPVKDEPCLYIALKALEEAGVYLQRHVGVNVSKWTWGSVHFNEYPHEPFGMTPIKGLFQRSIPAPGNARTVFVSGMRPDKDDFEGLWSPNTRMVASLKEGDKSYFVVDTGVSDVVLSKHYDDQMKLFYRNEYVEMDEEGKKQWKDLTDIKFGGK